MRKRLLLPALVVGLLVNLAFVTSSRASSTTIYVNSELGTVPANVTSITGVDVTFSGVTSMSDVLVSFPKGSTGVVNGNAIDITIPSNASIAFMGLGQAAVNFSFLVPGTGLGLGIKSTEWVTDKGKYTGTSTLLLDPPGVPEPASMSLLGIGMAGLFAFRRYFRRNTNVSA